MAKRLKVCLILEGSYPYITGGVSAWVQEIIGGLSDFDFALFTVSPVANQPLRYQLPPNVVEHRDYTLMDPPPNSKGRPMVWNDTDFPDLLNLIGRIPEGRTVTIEEFLTSGLWERLLELNQKNNPVFPFSDYYWAWQSMQVMVFRLLGLRPPEADIYHAVSTGFAGILGLAAQARRKKPFLLTEHGLYHKERQIEIRKANFVKGHQRDLWIDFYQTVSRSCYERADGVIALFEENRQKQIELGAPKAKARVIPNGIEFERFSGVRKTRRPGFQVGLVGRVVPIKDIKTFIMTARTVLASVPDAVFSVVGPTDEDPDYYEDCWALVESLRLGPHFVFTGRQDVLEYYAFLDVLMLTSVREAQPLVILEAWSAGIPCVSTRVGNVPEMLEYDERFLASPKDAAKLASSVLYIRDHPEEMALINQRNRAKVESLYHRTKLLQQYRELYTDHGAR